MGQAFDPSWAELAEAELNHNFVAAASAETRKTLGLDSIRLGGGVALAMANDPMNYWSRALGFGFAEPVTSELVGEIVDFYRSRSVPSAVVQVAPSVLPPDWPEICEKYGLVHSSSWVKLGLDLTTDLPQDDDGPVVERIGTPEAEAWATAMIRFFGMPEGILEQITTSSLDNPDLHGYAIRSEGEIVSVGGLFVHGEGAEMFSGATMPEHRGKGYQSALLRARIRAAAAAGCRWLFTETGAEGPGEHNTSLHNMLRAGMTQLYVRDNYRWNLEPKAA